MKNVTTYVGIDVYKKDLFVGMLMGHQKARVTRQLANEPNAVQRLVRKLERESPGRVQVFYEAGPCGYALQTAGDDRARRIVEAMNGGAIVPVCLDADLINVLCQTDACRAPCRRTGCSICGAQVFVTRPS